MSNKPDQALLTKLQQLSPQQREALLKKLQSQKKSPSTEATKITAIKREQNDFPLSAAQQRLWFLEQLSDSHASYNIAAAFNIHGPLNTKLLDTTITFIINKYESLRTYFPADDSGVKQKIHATLDWQLSIVACAEDDIKNHIHQAANTRFDLAKGPLFNIQLLKINNASHILIVVMHHIISDAWSTQLLLNDVSTIYNTLEQGDTIKEPTLTLQYIDYAAWQQTFLESEAAAQQLQYWQTALSNINNLDFPIDKTRPTLSSYNGAVYRTHFNQEQTQTLKLWCKQHSITLFCALLSAYEILLYRYTQQDDFCIGIPVANRHLSESENIMGFFVNSLAMHCDAKAGNNFLQICKAVQKRLMDAHSNQDIPFEQLVTQLKNVERNPAINPIFQTFFTLIQDNIATGLQLNHLRCEYVPADIDGTKFDLSLNLREQADGLECHFEYNRDLFFADTISALCQHFINLTQILIGNENAPIETIEYINPTDYAAQMDYEHGWNATTKHHLPCSALHILFEQVCEKTPQAIAVADELSVLNYQTLNEQANQLAHYLRKNGVGANTPVAVFLDRSIAMSVALLAILKAGGAYLPLTTNLPVERIAHIVTETKAQWIICSSKQVPLTPSSQPLLFIDQSLWQDQPKNNPVCINKPNNIFNIIYTSGSTGNPKGVMVPHQGIINRLLWMQDHYQLVANDIILQKTPYNFDVSVWELFWPLITGASLFFAKPDGHKDNDYLINLIQQKNITHIHFVPSMLKQFLDNEKIHTCHNIKKVFTSGEALLTEHNTAFFKHFTSTELHNLYGPTEASIDVSYYHCQANQYPRTIPIGKPIDNTQLHILDKHLQILPIGAIGELYIGGIGLALGYYQQEALTAKSFIKNPYYEKGHPSSHLYKTGDLARYLTDGNIEYLGRNDNQVKIRGFRIELGEIENQLRKLSNVKDAIVISKAHADNTLIVAYIITGDNPLNEKSWFNDQLKKCLPDYMLPNVYMQIEQLPLSANGKLDKKQLPAIDFNASNKKFSPPTSATEIALANIWQELLHISNISNNDNFFDIGGHSLLAAQMLTRIRSHFNIELPLKTLFELNTIETLAKLISAMSLANNNANDDLDNDDYEEGTL